jgi:hypothetical protein
VDGGGWAAEVWAYSSIGVEGAGPGIGVGACCVGVSGGTSFSVDPCGVDSSVVGAGGITACEGAVADGAPDAEAVGTGAGWICGAEAPPPGAAVGCSVGSWLIANAQESGKSNAWVLSPKW